MNIFVDCSVDGMSPPETHIQILSTPPHEKHTTHITTENITNSTETDQKMQLEENQFSDITLQL
jgi:hypothetical protein